MISSKRSITGILLAGGKSKRMGQEKGELILGRKKLLEYPLGVLEAVCDEILISSCKELDLAVDHKVVCDEIEGIGPLGGILTCLGKSTNEINVVLSYDMPMVNQELIEYLISNSPGWDIVLPAMSPEKPEPLCGIYRKSVLEVLQQMVKNQQFAVHGALPLTRSQVLTIDPGMPFYRPGLFMNINRPADLEHLQEDFTNEK
jgi:molybdopterin-guanine dinucleotide biosynthesis protein A